MAALARLARVTLLLCAAAATGTGSAAAQSRVYHIRSKILGEDRIVHVSLPPNYALAKQRYEVTYLLDGSVKSFFDLTVAAAGYDAGGDVHDYALPRQIVVGIEQKDRGVDLGRNQEVFERHLVEEVVPYIDHEFRTVRYRTLIGHSLGGRFALNTICRNPGVFASIIAISPGIGDSTALGAFTECLRRDFTANRTVVRQLVITAGEREVRLTATVGRLRDFLRDSAPPNWHWTFVDGAGLGHTETPYVAIPRGIRFVHDKSLWEMPPAQADSVLKGNVEPEAAIAAWYRVLGARMGYDVPPSAKWLRATVAAHFARHENAAAEDAARRYVADYPDDLSSYADLADALLSRGNIEGARGAINEALRTLDRLEFFDETEKALRKAALHAALEKLKAP